MNERESYRQLSEEYLANERRRFQGLRNSGLLWGTVTTANIFYAITGGQIGIESVDKVLKFQQNVLERLDFDASPENLKRTATAALPFMLVLNVRDGIRYLRTRRRVNNLEARLNNINQGE